MAAANETVRDRIDRVRIGLTTLQLVVGLFGVTLVGVALLFVQEPAVHEALHDFRHIAGVACH